jgi:hypothetical protein
MIGRNESTMKGNDLKSRARALFVNFLISAFSCFAGLLLAELIVRLALPQTLILRRPDVWYPVEGLGWNRTPNLDTIVNFGGAGAVRLLTDGEGNRISAAGKVHSPAIRILALGDSFVEALQVEYEQTMTWLLQEAITQQTARPTEVVCAGVGGWRPNQYLLQSKTMLARSRFDLQLVFFYLENDLVGAKVDKYPPRHPAPYHRLRLPKKLNTDEMIEAFFYPINDWLETRSHAFILFRNRMQPLLARMGLTATTLPEVIYRSVANQEFWDITADICQEIAANGMEQGIATLFILIPPAYSFIAVPLQELGYDPQTMDLSQPYRIMKAKFEARRLHAIDLMPPFQEKHRAGLSCYGSVDSHFNAEGHRTAANTILPDALAALRKR